MHLSLSQAVGSFKRFLAKAVEHKRLKPATLSFYDHQLRHLTRVVKGKTPLRRVSPAALFRGPNTHHFLRACRRLWRFHSVTWPREVQVPACGRRDRVLSREEFVRLRHAADGQVRWLMWLIWHTGMRPEEVRHLRWWQVDEIEGFIELREFKSKARRKDGLQTRFIPLAPCVRRAFAHLRKRSCEPAAESRIFLNYRGREWTMNAVRLAVKRARRKAGLTGVVIYNLRHAWATRMIENGMPITTVAAIMGHRSLSTTRGYLHPRPAWLRRELERYHRGKVNRENTTAGK